MSKVTSQQSWAIYERFRKGEHPRAIAKSLGLALTTIYRHYHECERALRLSEWQIDKGKRV